MKIEKDKLVSINYVLRDKDGNQIDSSNGTPLEYVHGNGFLISGLEAELEGKEEGDKFMAKIAPKDAYGEYDKSLIIEVPRTQFDTSVDIQPGMQFQSENPMGPSLVTVTKVTADTVTIDANHELAGKELFFDVDVVGVRDLTEEEKNQMKSGCGGSCGSCGGCGGDEGYDSGSCGGCGGCN